MRLRRESDFSGSALEVAGYLAPEHRGYLREIEGRMKAAGLAHEFHYRGELDRAGKIEFLRSLSILSVPSTYDEPKGIFLLEAMASGVAVVEPRRGAFREILERTGGGVMVVAPRCGQPGGRHLRPMEKPRIGRRTRAPGCGRVRGSYSASQMAVRALEVFQAIAARQAHA